MSYESLSRYILESDSEKDILPSSIIVSTATQVLWEHRANINLNLSAAPSLANSRQKHFEWIQGRLAELGDRAKHVWQYGLLLESLQSYSDLFELLIAEADDYSSTLLLNLSLCARDVSTDSSLDSLAVINNGSAYYIEEISVLAKRLLSLRNESKPSAVTVIEGTGFSQRKF